MDEKKWQKLLDEIGAKGSGRGPVVFLPNGKIRVRLVAMPGTENDEYPKFFTETARFWKGKEKTRYLILCVILSVEDPQKQDLVNPTKAVPLLVPPTVIKDILGLLAEGYDLLSPHGYGISITKTGSGLDTSYSTIASPKPLVIDLSKIEFPTDSLEVISANFIQSGKNRGKDLSEVMDNDEMSAGGDW